MLFSYRQLNRAGLLMRWCRSRSVLLGFFFVNRLGAVSYPSRGKSKTIDQSCPRSKRDDMCGMCGWTFVELDGFCRMLLTMGNGWFFFVENDLVSVILWICWMHRSLKLRYKWYGRIAAIAHLHFLGCNIIVRLKNAFSIKTDCFFW